MGEARVCPGYQFNWNKSGQFKINVKNFSFNAEVFRDLRQLEGRVVIPVVDTVPGYQAARLLT